MRPAGPDGAERRQVPATAPVAPADGATARVLSTGIDDALLRRIEDAGINASAPPQQRWLDGWIVRLCPGKAKRARCVNAVAPGVRPVADRLDECAALYRAAGLPLVVRITPYTEPADLDARLATRGWEAFDPSFVMVHAGLGRPGDADGRLQRYRCPVKVREAVEPSARYAAAVGALRGSTPAEIEAHAQRLQASPVPYTGIVWRDAQGGMLSCGQFALEGALAGLYDVFTAPQARGRGLATALCARLLQKAAAAGAQAAYLQVGADQAAAQAVYRKLGFVPAYAYHYRGAVADPG